MTSPEQPTGSIPPIRVSGLRAPSRSRCRAEQQIPYAADSLSAGKFFSQSHPRRSVATHTVRDDPPILTDRDNKRSTVVKRGLIVAIGGTAIVIAGLSGCSSSDK